MHYIMTTFISTWRCQTDISAYGHSIKTDDRTKCSMWLSPVSLHCTGSASSFHITKPMSLGPVNIISSLHSTWLQKTKTEFQINVHVDPINHKWLRKGYILLKKCTYFIMSGAWGRWGKMRISSRQVGETIFEVLIAVWLKIQIVWDGMLCWTAPHSRRPESSVNNAASWREKLRLMYTASTRICHAL